MSEFDENISIGSQNSAARERGVSVAHEYERIVSTFNRVLEFKEKVRLTLEKRIVEIQELVKNNLEKLNTLNRNIDIYDLNIVKIVGNLED